MVGRQYIIIESKRLYVRPWREEDLEPLGLIFKDPEVVRYTGDGRPWTVDQVSRLVRWGIDDEIGHEPGFFNCPLIYRPGGHRQADIVIGRVGINPLGDEAGGVDESTPE
ncbi:MAG: GNAT family N-acetyltransferase, partial [Candidatus Promineifilaceae bacterium]